jgi:hypothetical protein
MAETDRRVEFLPLVGAPARQEDDDMFTVKCPDHGCDVLLSEKRIRALHPIDRGLRVQWECWCGHVGSFVTGRALMVGRNRPAV